MNNSLNELPQNSKDDLLKQRWYSTRAILQSAKINQKIAKCEPTGIYQLSNVQKRFWLLEYFQELGATYNVPFVMKFTGPVTINKIESICNLMVQRHEILRSVIEIINNVPFIKVRQIDGQPVNITTEYEASETRVFSKINTEIHKKIDLYNGPTVSFKLFIIDSDCKILLVCSHAIFFDRSSIALFTKGFAGLLQDSTINNNELTYNYWDYSQWQNSIEQTYSYTNKLAWWKCYLNGAPESLALLTDYQRPKVENHNGDIIPIQIDSNLTHQIDSLCQNLGITKHIFITAVYTYLLGLLGSQSDIVIGIPVTLRNRKEFLSVLGPFINTLPIRVKISRDLTIRQFLISVSNVIQDTLKYQDIPFEQIIRELNVPRDLSKSPIFQTMLIYQNISLNNIDNGDNAIKTWVPKTNTSLVDLTLCIEEKQGELTGYFEYASSLFKKDTIEVYSNYFISLLSTFINKLDCHLISINLPSKFTSSDNSTGQYPSWDSIPDYFQTQVNKTPDSIAIIYEKRSITYDVLNSRANILFELLKNDCIKPGTIIGILLPPSPALIIAELGILKNNCTVAVLNYSDPYARIIKMLDQANVSIILTTAQRSNEFKNFTVFSITLFGDSIKKDHTGDNDAIPNIDAAYCVFTSGSTGIPKCVLLSSDGINNHTFALIKEFHITENDRIALSLNPSFVASIWQIWAPLFSGATLFIYEQQNDIRLLFYKVREDKITIIEFTPSALDSLLQTGSIDSSALESLRYLILTGEPISPVLVRKFYNEFEVQLINLYGQTECCDDTLLYHIPFDFSGIRIPAGKSIDNTTSYIIDEYFNHLPVLIPGELCTEGVCLALGYITDKNCTTPVTETINGKKFYRTGDLARRLPDGTIEILGRIDNQIKIHGCRVELGEIETALNSFVDIRQAIAKYIEKKDNSPEGIALYIVANEKITQDEIRRRLISIIPLYMIPKWIIFIDEIPINNHGKIDKTLLPLPNFRQQDPAENIQPESSDEKIIHKIWKDVLRVEDINVTDDFFMIGGDSFQAVSIMANLEKEFHNNLPISILFEFPTIRSLAQVIRFNNQCKYHTIVTIRANKNSKFNLFCIHALAGNVLHYRHLGKMLNPAISLFGVYSPDQNFFSSKITIPEMAKLYLEDILQIQSKGPYHFIGYCMGGLLSYEIARILSESGQEVSFVGIIDTEPPFIGSHLKYWQQRIKYFLGETHQRQWISLIRKIKRILRLQSTSEKDFSNRINSIRGYRPAKASLYLDIIISSELFNKHGKEFFKPWSKLVNGNIDYQVMTNTNHMNLLSENNVHQIVKIIENRIL